MKKLQEYDIVPKTTTYDKNHILFTDCKIIIY